MKPVDIDAEQRGIDARNREMRSISFPPLRLERFLEEGRTTAHDSLMNVEQLLLRTHKQSEWGGSEPAQCEKDCSDRSADRNSRRR